MAQLWDDILLQGSFDGVEFDFVSVKDEHSNDIDQQKFPGRPGTFIAPRARNGSRFDIFAVFIEDDYPEQMNALVEALDNGGVPKKFIHPIYGEFMAAPERFTVSHDVEDGRDSGTIQLSLLEHTDKQGPTKNTTTTPARVNQVRSLADEVFATLSSFQAAVDNFQNNDYVLQVEGAINAANSMADSLEATGDQLSSVAISSSANGAVAKIDQAIETLADYETTEQYELSAALLAMASALSAMALELIEQKPPLQTYSVVADTNLLQWVFDRYGDPSRVEEVLALNSFPDPLLIPAGFKVVAYGE